MKKFFTFLVFATLVLFAGNTHASIHRVGYFGTTVANVDYSTLQAAHDASAAGDTILIFPGSWGCNVSKKIVVLGYGYFVTGTGSNANLQNITGSLSVGITLNAGSDNSVFDGLDNLHINGDLQGTTLSNITIRRCYVSLNIYGNNSYNNWQILQCYLGTIYLDAQAYGTSSISSLTVNNCYIKSLIGNNAIQGKQAGQFNNCVFEGDFYPYSYCDLNNGSWTVKNSIFKGKRVGDQNVIFGNDIATSNYPLPSGNSNLNIDQNTFNGLFVGQQSTTSTDGYYVLADGSVAKGAGAGGTDCGIFGGAKPYKLSGIPEIPAFYKLTAPSNVTSSNPYTITFSVRSNN